MAITEACMANLHDLTSLSKIINEKSDEINRIIGDVESQLAQLRIGVEAWLDADHLASRRYQELAHQEYSDHELSYLVETYLGYARQGDGFALLVKDVRYIWTTEYGDGEWKVEHEGSPKPLRQASRSLRVKALSKLEDLFEAIKKEAEATIDSIEKGRKAVEALKGSDDRPIYEKLKSAAESQEKDG